MPENHRPHNIPQGFAPAPDPRAVKAGLLQELGKLKPRVEAMNAIAGKMNTVADQLYTISTSAHANSGDLSGRSMVLIEKEHITFVRDALLAMVRADMVLIEAQLTSVAFQFESFIQRQADVEQAIASLDNRIQL